MKISDFTPETNIRSAMDNHGEMSRFRAKNGIRISPSPSVSTYIICTKIKRIIREYALAKPAVSPKKIDRMISKLDKLGKAELEYLYHLGTEESVSDMITAIGYTFGRLSKEASQWKGGPVIL